MRIAILQANLGNFDSPQDPKPQDFNGEVVFHRWTDDNFLPIAGLSGRFQYRIPKLFGWQMYPGYDMYIWIDGGISFKRTDSVAWYVEQMADKEAFFFAHPWRHSIKQEVDHIEEYLKRGSDYLTPRYKNGLHKEMYAEILQEQPDYKDDFLLASTVFAYKNTPRMQQFMKDWWYYQSRYYTCDQIAQTYVASKVKDHIHIENVNLFAIGHVSLVSHHKK